MKTFKSIFLGTLLMALFCLSTATLATNMIGVSVFLDNMYDKPKTSNITKQTYTRQTFEPFEIYKDRQSYVALFTSDGTATDGLWRGLNKKNVSWEIENFGTQSQMIPGSYYLQFKTTGVYIGGTGITGFWTYDE